jgi:hypothetical protein
MTRDYQELPSLAQIVLEESYVLDIEAHPSTIEFKIEFVLAGDHPEYRPPGPEASYCTRPGRLRFFGITRLSWADQAAPPAEDAAGEIDFGNIDSFKWAGSEYSLDGDWGPH